MITHLPDDRVAWANVEAKQWRALAEVALKQLQTSEESQIGCRNHVLWLRSQMHRIVAGNGPSKLKKELRWLLEGTS